MDYISGWPPFSTATVTISDDYTNKILHAQDLYAYIHKYRSLLNIEFVSLETPVTIKGSWLAITKLEIQLKNLSNRDAQNGPLEASSKDSNLNFDLVFTNFKESVKLKQRQSCFSGEQSQICTPDLLIQKLQNEAIVEISNNVISKHEDEKEEELSNKTTDIQHTADSGLLQERLDCSQDQSFITKTKVMSSQSYSQKQCDKNVCGEISVPNPVVLCQPSDVLNDEFLNFNTYLTEKPNFKDVQEIFYDIYTTETIKKFKMGASRNEECNVIFKAVDKADDFEGCEMNTGSGQVNGNTENEISKSVHAKTSVVKRASNNKKERKDTYIREMGRSRKRRSNRKLRDFSVDVPHDSCEEFHVPQKTLEEVNSNEIMLNDSTESIVDKKHFQPDNEVKALKKHKGQKEECHSCDLCNFFTWKRPYLRMHKKRVHALKKLKCSQCSKEFAIEKDLRKHMKCHNEAQNCCDVCGKVYKDKRKLQAHKITHSEDYVKPAFPCEFCYKNFSTKYVLACHIQREHLGMKKSLACPTCGKTFTQKHSYLQHANIHLGIKPYMCDICNRRFAYQKSLKEHKAMHNEVKAYKCPICFKTFQQTAGLRAHRKTHTSLKDYVCSFCALIRHERIHFDVRPFECTLCSKFFGDDSVLRRHMMAIHKRDATSWKKGTVRHSLEQLEAMKKS